MLVDLIKFELNTFFGWVYLRGNRDHLKAFPTADFFDVCFWSELWQFSPLWQLLRSCYCCCCCPMLLLLLTSLVFPLASLLFVSIWAISARAKAYRILYLECCIKERKKFQTLNNHSKSTLTRQGFLSFWKAVLISPKIVPSQCIVIFSI